MIKSIGWTVVFGACVGSISVARAAPPVVLDDHLRGRCVAVLRDGMAADQFWPSIHAAEGLTAAGLGEEVRRRLLPKLETEKDDQHRCGLAREIVRAGDRRYARVMLQILASKESNGRTHACESLYKVWEIGDGRLLREAMQEGPPNQRLMAAAALGRWGNPEAMQLIRRSLDRDDPALVQLAAWVLGRIGDSSDIPALQRAYDRASKPLVRTYINNALATLGDGPSKRRLVADLSHSDAAIRTYAATFAGEVRDPACRAPLARLLDDPELDVRIRAAHSLIELSRPAPIDRHAEIRNDVYRHSKEHPRLSEGSIVALRDHRLLYATTQFTDSASDFARAQIIARESDDAGRNWGPMRVLQQNVGKRNVMSATLRYLGDPLDPKTKLGLFYLVKNGFDDLQVWLRTSSDDGMTFSKPARVTQTPGYHVMNNDRVARLRSGRLIVPVASTTDVRKANHFRVTCWLSDDAGNTWRQSKTWLDYERRGAMEPDVVELEDGSLLMIVRTQLGHIAYSRSQDQGETWSRLESWGVEAPEAPATLRVVPSTGDLLLVWNDRFVAGSGHGGRRTPLVGAVSRDGGRTWLPKVVLEDDPKRTYAYTSLTFVRGRAVMSYYVESGGRIGSRFLSLPIGRFYAKEEREPRAPVGGAAPKGRDAGPAKAERGDGSSKKHRFTNRLANETSPYLLMHAHNPVDWYAWGPEALAKAKREKKPIFLSIGYSSCHWCHVMERESFMDDEIAALLNKHFVCIKVDREERPDIDTIYMTAVQVMGRQGGWPLSVFLTPEGKPFFGFTYLPARDNDRPGTTGFLSVLRQIHEVWTAREKAIRFNADQLAQRVKLELEHHSRKPARRWSIESVDRVISAFERQHDSTWGGFGFVASQPERPKFPREPALMLLIDRIETLPDGDARRGELMAVLTTTLDHMAQGGIRDHVGGGFHRYSVDRSWRIPHFEKMLYNNGQLCSVYSRAYHLTGNVEYRWVVEELIDFVLRELRYERGAFYSALDADSDGEEGKFYRWTRKELQAVLAPDEYRLFATVYGTDGRPDFEGQYYVPQQSKSLRETAQAMSIPVEALYRRLKAVRGKLLAVRGQRVRPMTDTKILTAWNGLMVRGLADAARCLKQPTYRDAAERAAEFVWIELRRADGTLCRTYAGGRAKLDGYLTDHAMMVDGMLGLHAATGKKVWLERAAELMQAQVRHFGDSEHGGFYFTSDDHESLLARLRHPTDNAWPSGEAISVLNLLELSQAKQDAKYRSLAIEALGASADHLRELPTAVPTTARGVLKLVRMPPSEVERPDQ